MFAWSTTGYIEFVIVVPTPVIRTLCSSSNASGEDKFIDTVEILDEVTRDIELMLHSEYWGKWQGLSNSRFTVYIGAKVV